MWGGSLEHTSGDFTFNAACLAAPLQSLTFALSAQGLLALDLPRTTFPAALTDGRALGHSLFVLDAA